MIGIIVCPKVSSYCWTAMVADYKTNFSTTWMEDLKKSATNED
jgi:hypothetical protein